MSCIGPRRLMGDCYAQSLHGADKSRGGDEEQCCRRALGNGQLWVREATLGRCAFPHPSLVWLRRQIGWLHSTSTDGAMIWNHKVHATGILLEQQCFRRISIRRPLPASPSNWGYIVVAMKTQENVQSSGPASGRAQDSPQPPHPVSMGT